MHEALERYRIGYVSEDRKGEGLLLAYPVRDNIAITIWRRIAGFLGLITPGAEAKAAAPFVGRLGDPHAVDRRDGLHPFGREPAEGLDREMAGRAD